MERVKATMQESVSDIEATCPTVEQHTKKVVEMHYLARNFAARLRQELQRRDNFVLFGETLRYNKTFWVSLTLMSMLLWKSMLKVPL